MTSARNANSHLRPLCGLLAGVVLAACLTACGQEQCATQETLSVMSFNIGDCCGSHPTLDDLLAAFGGRDMPDVLLLQEFRQAKDDEALARVAKALGYDHAAWVLDGLYTRAKLATMSRYPIVRRQLVPMPSSKLKRVALVTFLQVDGVQVLAANVHFDHIPKKRRASGDVRWSLPQAANILADEMLSETTRSRMAQELVDWLATQQADAVIVGGDLNTIPQSKAVRILAGTLDDVLWSTPDYLRGTYRKIDGPVSPRVDFIFHSAGLTPREAAVGDIILGDHLPVSAVFGLCTPQAP